MMLTVGITAYREGEWLRDCWNSVLAQTCQDWEAILVLDGGADEKTERIFDALSHPRLKKIKCPENIGPYPARELIFQESRHDIILHSDADDYFLPNAVEMTLRTFSDESVRWIGIGCKFIYEDGHVQDNPGQPTTIEQLLMECRFPGYLLFRRSVWLELGRYDPELKRGHADVDFYLKILKNGLRGQFAPETCHIKRQHSSSVSSVSSYAAQLHYFHERIVMNNPEIFAENPELRDRFLAQGYLYATWNLLGLNRYDEAGAVARKYVTLRGTRAIWPAHLAGRIPVPLIRILLCFRRVGGRLARTIQNNRLSKAPTV